MVVGIAMVRDEADILEATLRHMEAQVDHLYVADNGSTDGSLRIIQRVCADWRIDDEVGYYQSRKMSALAAEATLMQASWIVPFDADEIWLPRVGGNTIAQVLESLPEEALIAEAVVLDHVATASDPEESNPVLRMGWRRREALPLRKVAVRAHEGLTIHQGNHGATFDGVEHPLTVTGQLELRHYPLRSSEQMIRKARNGAQAYAATDLPDSAGKHWRDWARLSDEQLREVFHTYYWSAGPESDPALIFDPAPVACPSQS